MTGPRAVVVTVGDELVSGESTDTNGGEVAARLARLGVPAVATVSVGDDVEQLAAVFRRAFASVDTVITTGGLGPTTDDLTREALAAVAGVAVVEVAAARERLIARYGGRAASVPQLRQATAPEGARLLDNPVGSAPGLALPGLGPTGSGVAYALPGPPHEMRTILEQSVVPDLLARYPSREVGVLVELRTAGLPESEAGRRVEALDLAPVSVSYLASSGEVRVRLRATGTDEATVAAQVEAAAERVRELLGDAVYGQRRAGPTGTTGLTTGLAGAVVALLGQRGETVATAESLTAGLVSARLADVPGASAVLRGGVTSYATDVKAGVLGVPAETLGVDGVVSEPTAAAMAAGARTLLGATWGVSTTGVAGPDPAEGQPVGTVCLGLCGPGIQRTLRLSLPDGGRAWLRATSTTLALDLLRRGLSGLT